MGQARSWAAGERTSGLTLIADLNRLNPLVSEVPISGIELQLRRAAITAIARLPVAAHMPPDCLEHRIVAVALHDQQGGLPDVAIVDHRKIKARSA